MKTIKILAGLILSIYLILVGLIGFGFGSGGVLVLSHVLAIISGILILAALWHHHACCCSSDKCSTDKKVE